MSSLLNYCPNNCTAITLSYFNQSETIKQQYHEKNSYRHISYTYTIWMFKKRAHGKTNRTATQHDMITEADTVWIVHKNSHNSQKNIHKLIRYDSCFYEISNGHRHLMMSNKNTRYAYTDNGNEYCVNISKSSDGQRVTNIFRTSPNNAGFLYSYHYTKDFKLLKIEVSDTVTYKRH